jgi:hypothetical protein
MVVIIRVEIITQCDSSDEISATAFYLHKYDEGLMACEKCLANPAYPASEKPRMQNNLTMYKSKIEESGNLLVAMRDLHSQQKTEPVKNPLESEFEKRESEQRIRRLLNRKKDRKVKHR